MVNTSTFSRHKRAALWFNRRLGRPLPRQAFRPRGLVTKVEGSGVKAVALRWQCTTWRLATCLPVSGKGSSNDMPSPQSLQSPSEAVHSGSPFPRSADQNGRLSASWYSSPRPWKVHLGRCSSSCGVTKRRESCQAVMALILIYLYGIARNVKRKRRRVLNLASPLSATLSVYSLSLDIFLIFTYNTSLRLYFEAELPRPRPTQSVI
ncbi:uncharacterized protein ARMOST_00162 [Armillaria ostoyae]|uniref:Uncharacterized protein n=1 Tax=Armillaria ostoyae TaxID=47428 RepID=A0A284QKC9_ARMOS|nr:uncharacterized protein ARMOST_00162 [Armillaria ostoyae]